MARVDTAGKEKSGWILIPNASKTYKSEVKLYSQKKDFINKASKMQTIGGKVDEFDCIKVEALFLTKNILQLRFSSTHGAACKSSSLLFPET